MLVPAVCGDEVNVLAEHMDAAHNGLVAEHVAGGVSALSGLRALAAVVSARTCAFTSEAGGTRTHDPGIMSTLPLSAVLTRQ